MSPFIIMKGIHQTPRNPAEWDMLFLEEDEFEAEKQRVTRGGNEIIFLPNYEYDEEGKIHIEDYSEIENYRKVQEIEKWMNCAAGIGVKSLCQKSQRGAIVVRNGEVLGEAFNGSSERCSPCLRLNIHDNSYFGICKAAHLPAKGHAEGAAVENAMKNPKIGGNLRGSRLYYVKTRGGVIIPSGDYACIDCSESILHSGIDEVVLWHKDAHPRNEQTVPNPHYDNESGSSHITMETHYSAHFVIYPARKLYELALRYVQERARNKASLEQLSKV